MCTSWKYVPFPVVLHTFKDENDAVDINNTIVVEVAAMKHKSLVFQK